MREAEKEVARFEHGRDTAAGVRCCGVQSCDQDRIEMIDCRSRNLTRPILFRPIKVHFTSEIATPQWCPHACVQATAEVAGGCRTHPSTVITIFSLAVFLSLL